MGVKSRRDSPEDWSAFMRKRLLLFCVLFLAACGGGNTPPVGRWQGVHDGTEAVIVARLEINDKGIVRVSAPNAFVEDSNPSPEERQNIIVQLRARLAETWPQVEKTDLVFDGKVFRKPGGVAPQLIWDGTTMTLVVYPGMHATIHMKLQKVADFE
jgi:hypothetical protein